MNGTRIHLFPCSPAVLLGRRDECEVLGGLVDGVRRGRSAVLVVRGETGVGKTALLDHAIELASDLTIIRAVGIESEAELAFAALHQLCGAMLDRLEQLPIPQRDALGVAFGLRTGVAPDRFLVGLAVLSLLSEVAEERPLVCVVDNAQWLDRASAQAMAFVARRIRGESVLLVFGAREPTVHFDMLPELVVEGLPDAEARELLRSVVHGPLDERVREQILAETRGNPLALLELLSGRSLAELAGGFGLPGVPPLSGQNDENFRGRLDALPVQSRRLLQLAAAESMGDPVLLWRAAGCLGIPAQAAASAADAGLLAFGTRVQFRHPGLRSAAYWSASLQDRQDAHRALAAAIDPRLEPDRRAWHRAHATPGPDEEVAAELERSAGQAQARGGLAAAAAFLERAAMLTPDPARLAERALAAAQVKLQAGAFDAAVKLLGMAEAEPRNELQRARVGLVRAQLEFVSNRGSDAPLLLCEAAKGLEQLDVVLARATYSDTVTAAMFAGRLASPGAGAVEVSHAARAAPRPARRPRAPDLLLDGLTAHFSEGYSAAAPILDRALRAFGRDMSAEEELRSLGLACIAALHLWDDEKWDVLSHRHVELARDAGALSELPVALSSRTYLLLFAGELAAAASLVAEVRSTTEVTGNNLAPYAALGLAALGGRDDEVAALVDATSRDVVARGEGLGMTATHWANAILCNGLGRHQEALAAAEQGSEYPDELGVATWSMVELIEAAVRAGSPERATDALRHLCETTSASGTDWALGVQARSRALLIEGASAERLYREAVERLGRTRVRSELARAHLLYGEWLRRQNRRADARQQLRSAHEMLTAMGIEGFAERARRELLATGETVRKRTVETMSELTPQETQIARLACDGLSNAQIGVQLFVSPRTVEWHLRKVFTKLGVSSRRHLHTALPDPGGRHRPG
jgi:DNA-binding CsgD family transcriptional regulator/tetratricopeptide (TPR) repeat protein